MIPRIVLEHDRIVIYRGHDSISFPWNAVDQAEEYARRRGYTGPPIVELLSASRRGQVAR